MMPIKINITVHSINSHTFQQVSERFRFFRLRLVFTELAILLNFKKIHVVLTTVYFIFGQF